MVGGRYLYVRPGDSDHRVARGICGDSRDTVSCAPAASGGMAQAGIVEALYVGELVGLILIWAGYVARVKLLSGNPAQYIC